MPGWNTAISRPAADDRAGRRQHRRDLGRVVGVVVIDAHPAGIALVLEAAVDAGEVGPPLDDRRDVHAEVGGQRERGGGVVRHVHADQRADADRGARQIGPPRTMKSTPSRRSLISVTRDVGVGAPTRR